MVGFRGLLFRPMRYSAMIAISMFCRPQIDFLGLKSLYPTAPKSPKPQDYILYKECKLGSRESPLYLLQAIYGSLQTFGHGQRFGDLTVIWGTPRALNLCHTGGLKTVWQIVFGYVEPIQSDDYSGIPRKSPKQVIVSVIYISLIQVRLLLYGYVYGYLVIIYW